MLIERDNSTTVLKSKLRYIECTELFKRLEKIKYAVVKGEPLSLAAYGEVGRRPSNDIDILVPKTEIKKVEEILIECGFESSKKQTRENRVFCLTQSHQIMPYVKHTPIINAIVDVNFDVFWGEYKGMPINMEAFLSDTINVNIYNNSVKTLKPEKLFIQLCLHHYKELNSIFLLFDHNFYRNSSFLDVYLLIKKNFSFNNVEDICSYCQKLEIAPYVYFVVYYTNRLFENEVLKALVERLKCQEGVDLLEHFGLDGERRKWHIDFETRMSMGSLHEYLAKILTKNDLKKIYINQKYFM